MHRSTHTHAHAHARTHDNAVAKCVHTDLQLALVSVDNSTQILQVDPLCLGKFTKNLECSNTSNEATKQSTSVSDNHDMALQPQPCSNQRKANIHS